jgi:hypothetical protein
MALEWHPTTAEIAFTIILMVVPWTFPEMSIIVKSVLWSIGWILLMHLGLTAWHFASRLPIVVKSCMALGLTSLLVGFAYVPIVKVWREEGAAKLTGELVANNFLPDVPSGNYALQIGSVGAKFIFVTTVHEPFQLTGDSLRFDTDSQTGEMLFSTIIRDRAGDIIVEVTNNKWRVSNQQNVSWDKNYLDDTLEVFDGRKRVALQIKLFMNGVQLQGEWHNDDEELALLIAQNGRHGPESEIFYLPAKNRRLFPITPIFKYSSREHWRQLEN